MSLNSRRLTPVPTEASPILTSVHTHQLPVISESPPESSPLTEDPQGSLETMGTDDQFLKEDGTEDGSVDTTPGPEDETKDIGEGSSSSSIPAAEGEVQIAIDVPEESASVSEECESKGLTKDRSDEIDPLMMAYSVEDPSRVYGKCSITSFGEGNKVKLGIPTPTKELVPHALLALFFSVFYLIWSFGAFFWLRGEEKNDAANLTLAVVIFGSLIVEGFYVMNSNICKGKIWKESKILFLLFLVPGVLPVVMGLANLVYAAKEQSDAQYKRPYGNTELVFLVESLAIALPQCVLQLATWMEVPETFPSLKHWILGPGLLIVTLGITFARIRYDAAKKSDRFGVGLVERAIRCIVIWASKVLWIITITSLLVSVRIKYGENMSAVAIAAGGLTLIYEVPMMFFAFNPCHRFMTAFTSLFFLLPQFVALVCHILWINLDDTVFKYNIGGFILGTFFTVESLCLAGWLLDRCSGHDLDFMSCYPHFFGNVFKACCKNRCIGKTH